MLDCIDFCIPVTHQRKLRWLCEEVQESVLREQRQRRELLETADQLDTLRRSWESEKMSLQQCLEQQERLLNSFSTEKKGILTVIWKYPHIHEGRTEVAILAVSYFQSASLWQFDICTKTRFNLCLVIRNISVCSCFYLNHDTNLIKACQWVTEVHEASKLWIMSVTLLFKQLKPDFRMIFISLISWCCISKWAFNGKAFIPWAFHQSCTCLTQPCAYFILLFAVNQSILRH